MDKLITSDITREELVRLLRQAQTEMDEARAEALRLESQLQKIAIIVGSTMISST